MQCQSCHKELVEGAKFCKFCGAKRFAWFEPGDGNAEDFGKLLKNNLMKIK